MIDVVTAATFDDAKALHLAGDLEGAAALYAAAAARDPSDFRSLHNRGVVLEALGHADEAEASYQAAIAAHPDGAWSHYSLARLRHLARRIEEAEAGYRRAIALEPELSEAHFNLGRLLLERGDASDAEALLRRAAAGPLASAASSLLGDALFAQHRRREALDAYRRTAEARPDDAVAQFDVGKTLESLRRADEAVECYRRSIALEPGSVAAREGLARALDAAGRRDEAIASVREWLAHEPANATATHVLASLGGTAAPDQASEGYVRETFDRFASSFDQTLARLEYQAPQFVATAVALAYGPPRGELEVLDAGCGTGLVGPLVRPWARRLLGVDLSPGMLAQAEGRGYDSLHERDLTGFLAGRPAAFDLIVSADTLCYFGALESVVGSAARALRPGGTLVFTLERLGGGERFALGPHGRYAHDEGYVRAVLASHAFATTVAYGALRMEGGTPVEGLVVTARR
jgi:predicted TPR repeat methyltransferase